MAKNKEVKTNAMRILERMKIEFTHTCYECEEFVDGLQTAEKLGLDKKKVYKTLVTTAPSKQYYVFVIPIEQELDLKKAAKAVGEKSVVMIPVKEITNVTGYVRGGCTAIGMKKKYQTVIHETAKELDVMYVSGGKIGCQICLKPEDLSKASEGSFADLCHDA